MDGRGRSEGIALVAARGGVDGICLVGIQSWLIRVQLLRVVAFVAVAMFSASVTREGGGREAL